MLIKDIPIKDIEWVNELQHGDPFIEDHVIEKIHLARDIPELKLDIISQMTDIMTECTQVIRHANAMKSPKECTCAQTSR